jgi:hypothetical protein
MASTLKVDPTSNSMCDSGADKWADFKEPMHFISDFFCGYQEETRLFDPPYTPEQAQVIKGSGKPQGSL